MDMSGFWTPGEMCDLRALSGMLCCVSNAMLFNVMISPLGILIGIGLFAIRLSTHGVVVEM